MGKQNKTRGEKQRDPPKPRWRFPVGERVLCRTSNGWEPGTIVKHNYVNPGDDEVHPYQVKMTNGRLIYVPWDEDTCCKLHVIAWWEDLLEREDLTDDEGVAALKVLSKGKDVNEKDQTGDSGLHVCIDYNWIPGVKQFLALKADPNIAGDKSKRPLIMAVCRRDISLVTMLLHAKADPTIQEEDPDKDPNFESKSFEERKWHRSSLHYAAEGSEALTRMLLGRRADVNQVDAQLKQPLHLAIEANQTSTIDLLLNARADVNTGNQTLGFNSTPLVDAAYRKDITLVEKLITAKADINHQGKQGMTPLHMAVRGRHPETVKMLVELKADVNIKVMGQTAAELAAKNGQKELASILGSDHIENEPPQPGKVTLDPETRKLLFLD